MSYIGIVSMPLSVFVIGIALLLIRNQPRTRRIGVYLALIGGAITLVVISFALTYPSPEALDKAEYLLFTLPPAQVDEIVIEPADDESQSYVNLVTSPMKVKSTTDIQRLLSALRTAQLFWPNHPNARWSCLLTVRAKKESVTIQVSDTNSKENGVLIYWWSARTQGWIIAEYRCDELGPILEELTTDRRG
jgi:hypothetical protein